jgi:hypothetical protein
VLKVTQEHKVQLEHREQQVLENKEILVIKEHKVLKVTQEHKVQLEHREQQVLENKEILVIQEHKVLKEQQEHKELLVVLLQTQTPKLTHLVWV